MRILFFLIFLISVQSFATPIVKSIRAVLHETATGSFSYDLLKSGALGNGIVSYNGLLVTIEVESKGGLISLSLFEIGKSRKILFSSEFNVTGKAYIPAFASLAKIGCSPIEVEVSVMETGKRKIIKKETLPLGPCYE